MPSNTDPKTIMLKDNGVKYEELLSTASEAILPGHLCALVAAGTVSKHGTAAGKAQAMFALENELDGGSISDAYADGETVRLAVCPPGTEIYAILEDGHTIAKGALLESAGDGTLQATTGNFSVAIALEAVTTSGSTDFIRVEVL